MRSIGIDPGTNSFGIFGLENDVPFLDEKILTKKIMESPDELTKLISEASPFDILIAPSGFGVPFKPAKEINKSDIFKMTMKRQDESFISLGLQKVIETLGKQSWNAYYIPGVKQFKTVPAYRKINVLDMGTADKVCSAVTCMWELFNAGRPLESMDFIMLEIGSSFSAAVAVKSGKFINGLGGSIMIGFGSIGYFDAELAYLLQPFNKKEFYKSGMNSIIKREFPDKSHFESTMMTHPLIHDYFELFIERTVKDLIGLRVTSGFDLNKKTEIYVSGHYSGNTFVMDRLKRELQNNFKINLVDQHSTKAGAAAKGAALIGLGLMDGNTKNLIDHIELRTADCDSFFNIRIVDREL